MATSSAEERHVDSGGEGRADEIFISYSRRDDGFVRALHAYLTGRGRGVWVDWEDIPPASRWEQDIGDSIDAAESFVFVASPSSLASEECGKELRRAQEGGKRIVPLALDGAAPAEAPAAIRELNWIWCREADDRDVAFAALETALNTELEWARAHTRLIRRAVDWDERKDASLLLRGKDLSEAERALADNAGKEPRPTDLQQRYLRESRRAATRRQRILVGGVLIALAISIVLGVVALLQRNDARSATRRATSTALASASTSRLSTRPDQSLLLALAAYGSNPSADARAAAFGALQRVRQLGVIEMVHGDSPVRDTAFAPNGRTLAVGSADGSVRVWDTRSRQQIATLVESGSPIVSVGFARRGRVVAAGSADGVVRLWDARSGKAVATDRDAGRAIVVSAVSEDGRKVAAMSKGGTIWLWEAGNPKPSRLGSGPSTDRDLAFSPDGETLAAATTYDSGNSIEGYVELYDLGSGKQRELPNDVHPVNAVAFSPDGHTLVTGGYTDLMDKSYGELRLWDMRQPGHEPIASFEKGPFINTIAFGPHGRRFVAGREDGSVVSAVAAPGGWKKLETRLRVPGAVTSLALGRNGKVAVAPDGAATVRVFRLAGPVPFGRVIGDLKGNALGSVIFSANGRKVLAPDGEAGALVMPLDGTKPYRLAPPSRGASVDSVAFAGDGRVIGTLVTPASMESSESWNLSKHKRLKLIPDASEDADAIAKRAGVGDPGMAIVAKDGHTYAIGDNDGKVWIWDSRRSDPATLLGGNSEATGQYYGSPALAFTPDGKMLAVASPFRLWDVASGKPLGPPLPSAYVDSLAFSPDGRALASTDESHSVRLWKPIAWADTSELRAQICNLVAGDLTRNEWASIATGISYRRACSR